MKEIIKTSILAMVLTFMFTSALTAQNYAIDIESSKVKWMGSKVVSGSHYGSVTYTSGNLVFKDGLVESGKFIIDMNSLECLDLEGPRKDRLLAHLKSDDFFSVETFPLASLSVKSSESISDTTLELHGDLTIKGKTSPVIFESSFTEDGNTIWFKGVMEVDRTLYDVRFGSGKFFDNLGDKAINDIFTLEFELRLDKM